MHRPPIHSPEVARGSTCLRWSSFPFTFTFCAKRTAWASTASAKPGSAVESASKSCTAAVASRLLPPYSSGMVTPSRPTAASRPCSRGPALRSAARPLRGLASARRRERVLDEALDRFPNRRGGTVEDDPEVGHELVGDLRVEAQDAGPRQREAQLEARPEARRLGRAHEAAVLGERE